MAAGAGELRRAVRVDGARDGNAPHDAEAAHERPRARRQRRVPVRQWGREGREQGRQRQAGAKGLDDLEADPGACARVLVEDGEEAEADDDEGERGEEDGLVEAEFCEQAAAHDGGKQEGEDGGQEHDAGAVGTRGEDALEVDREEEVGPHSDHAVEKGEEED